MRVSLSILLKYDAAVFKFILNTFQSRCGGGSVVSDENVSSSHESSVRKISISTYFLSNSYTLATTYREKSSCCPYCSRLVF